MNLEKEIFNIDSKEEFERIALEIFRFQAQNCNPYAEYITHLGVAIDSVKEVSQIPFMPIELYKSHYIYIGKNREEELFESSGTTGSVRSRHHVAKAQLYIDSFTKGFEQFYATLKDCNIYAILPNYIENKNSSLLYMINNMVENCYYGKFFLYNRKELVEELNARDKRRHTLLFGVSFALLDLAEEFDIDLSESVTVMETGGMKGRREEITREQLHEVLCRRFHVEHIHSEYGMCECLSQSYSNGDGLFHSPAWQKIVIRDINNPFKMLKHGSRGGVNIIDLANIYSCSFIQTEDVGVAISENSFRIEGRVDKSDIRGCNLLINS